ncbi:MAG: UvrD-helicase domain-containing protein [Simkaniaceae bacterium]|nr:UvrD-helicase domain-containing protein [Simkaniaceae bacterium]
MRAFNCLSKEKLETHHIFLEASAGTGKTFAIENLYTRLILGYDHSPISIDSILVVTFTKAATRELKIRIARTLENAYNLLLYRRKSGIDYLDELIDHNSYIDQSIGRLRNALDAIESMQVFTIHSFCFRMLQEFALSAKQAFLDESPNEIDPKSFILDALRSISHTEISPVQFKILLKSFRHDFKRLLSKILSLIDYELELEMTQSFEDLRHMFNRELKELPALDRDQLMADLKAQCHLYQKLMNRNKELHLMFEEQLLSCVDWLVRREITPLEFEKLVHDETHFLELMIDANLKKTVKEKPPLSYAHLVDNLHEVLIPILKKAKNPHFILLHLIRQIHPKIKVEMQKNSEAFPDVSLHQMKKAIQLKPFLTEIQSKYCAAIIDEFQDTDKMQWDILSSIFYSHLNLSLFALVGDPKQSIYRFRKADISTYLRAKQQLGENAQFVLNTNYRSHPMLLESLHFFFGSDNQLFTFEESSQHIEFESILSGKEKGDDSLTGPRLQCCVVQEEVYQKSAYPSYVSEEKMIFPHIAEQVIALNKQGIEFREIAILIKDRYQAQRLQSYLQKVTIPSYSLRSSHIAKTASYRFLSLFLRVLQAPFDEKKIKEWISHPFMKGAHNIFIDQEEFILWQKRLIQLREIGLKRGLASLFNCFFAYDDAFFLSQLTVTTSLDDYSDLIVLLEMLLSESLGVGPDLIGLSRFLEGLRTKNADVSAQAQRRLLGHSNSVQIMTTHMSKGLEFEAVFALGPSMRNTMNEGISSHYIDERTILTVSNDNDLETLDEDSEKLRQLYVALTRAKQKLFVFIPMDMRGKKNAESRLSPIEIFLLKRFFQVHSHADLLCKIDELTWDQLKPHLFNLKNQCSLDFIVLSEKEMPLYQVKTAAINIPQPKVSHIDWRPKWFFSFSHIAALSKQDHLFTGNEHPPNEKPLSNEPQFPQGAVVGELLHELFEVIIQKALYYPYQRKSIDRMIERHCEFTILAPYIEQVSVLIDRAFHMTLADGFCLCDVPPASMLEEVEFIYRYEDQTYIKGFIDLVFEYGDAIYFIDWKSNDLGLGATCYDTSCLEAAMIEHQYDLQAAIYADVIHKELQRRNQSPTKMRFGGAVYLFLRGLAYGKGVYHFLPDLNRISKSIHEVKL